MDWTSIVIGIAAILFGLYTAYARHSNPGAFRKLEPMKKFWGKKAGYWIHVFGYTVLPILIGLATVWSGGMGIPLFE